MNILKKAKLFLKNSGKILDEKEIKSVKLLGGGNLIFTIVGENNIFEYFKFSNNSCSFVAKMDGLNKSIDFSNEWRNYCNLNTEKV